MVNGNTHLKKCHLADVIIQLEMLLSYTFRVSFGLEDESLEKSDGIEEQSSGHDDYDHNEYAANYQSALIYVDDVGCFKHIC